MISKKYFTLKKNGHIPANKGKKMSEAKISAANKGKSSPRKGKHWHWEWF